MLLSTRGWPIHDGTLLPTTFSAVPAYAQPFAGQSVYVVPVCSFCDVILSEVGDRDVILMHDIHSSTVEAAVRIIPKLHEMGYQLVTISELAEVEGGAENVSGHIKR